MSPTITLIYNDREVEVTDFHVDKGCIIIIDAAIWADTKQPLSAVDIQEMLADMSGVHSVDFLKGVG